MTNIKFWLKASIATYVAIVNVYWWDSVQCFEASYMYILVILYLCTSIIELPKIIDIHIAA